MDPLVKFLAFAFQDGAFKGEHTPEELLEKLSAREDCTQPIKTFLGHSSKHGLLNLTVCEMLSGKRSQQNRKHFGLNYLQEKCLARSMPDRVEVVMRVAREWDRVRWAAGIAA